MKGDVSPAKVVGTCHLNGWPDVMNALRFLIKVFKETGVLKTKVWRGEINMSELRHDTERILS